MAMTLTQYTELPELHFVLFFFPSPLRYSSKAPVVGNSLQSILRSLGEEH